MDKKTACQQLTAPPPILFMFSSFKAVCFNGYWTLLLTWPGTFKSLLDVKTLWPKIFFLLHLKGQTVKNGVGWLFRNFQYFHRKTSKKWRGPFEIIQNFSKKSLNAKKLKGLGLFLSQNIKKIEGRTLWWKKNWKKPTMSKKLKGAPFDHVWYYMLRGKLFWFSSLGQRVQIGALKFCRTLGRTILVTSGVSKKKQTKSHDYSRLFSKEKHRLKMDANLSENRFFAPNLHKDGGICE